LERQLDSVTRDATQFQIDNNAHLKQSSNLSKALATSERQVKQLEVEKQRLTREAQACRELAHSVDRNKDSLQSQFVQLTLERDRLVHAVEKGVSEKQAIEAQLKSEMLKTDRLEELLNSERTRKMESERSSIDIKHSRAEMEIKLKELSEHQETALNSTKMQLNETRNELTASLVRLTHLEAMMDEKDRGWKRLT
jgi:chromosome segregation ATPase